MNTSHSVQKSFEQSVHRYRPNGLTPSAPVSVAAPPPALVEFEFESPFVVELFLPGPGGAVV